MIILPQELDVWYVLPFIRKQLAHTLKAKHNWNQKKIASILNISEAAVSQYTHDKRAQSQTISSDMHDVFAAAAQQLVNGVTFLEVSQSLLQNKHIVEWKCALHRQKDKNLPDKCNVCFQESCL